MRDWRPDMPPTRQCLVRTISRDRATLILLYSSWPKPPSDSVNGKFLSLKKIFYNEFCILKAFLFKTNLPALMIKVIMLIN